MLGSDGYEGVAATTPLTAKILSSAKVGLTLCSVIAIMT